VAEAAVAGTPDEEPKPEGKVVQMPGLDERAEAISDRRAEGGITLRFSLDLPKLPSVNALPTWTHQQLINGGLIAAVALMAAYLVWGKVTGREAVVPVGHATADLRPNVHTEFNPSVEAPVVGAGSYVDRMASVIGNVVIGKQVLVAPLASIRGDEGQPIYVGDGSNVQDFVLLHALETFADGAAVEKNLVTVDGKKYAVYVGKRVSLAHQSQVHGPAAVLDNTFVGMQALVFKSTVGKNVVIEPGAKIIGVTIAEGRYVPAGSIVTSQAQADALPQITPSYPFATLNDGVLRVNGEFADAYLDLANGKTDSGASEHGTAPKTTGAAAGGH